MNEIIGVVGLVVAVLSILISTAVSIVIESSYDDMSITQSKSCRPNQLLEVDTVIEDNNRRHILVSNRRSSAFSSGEYRHGGWGHEAYLVANDGIEISEDT